ncbi:MAG: hypothetical protein WAN86_28105 [Hyphomicrobiaceae bacterium]
MKGIGDAGRIFISYRRSDSRIFAHRMFDRLVEMFGPQAVFIDIDRIPPGVDFRTHIRGEIAQAGVVLGPTLAVFSLSGVLGFILWIIAPSPPGLSEADIAAKRKDAESRFYREIWCNSFCCLGLQHQMHLAF